MDIQKLKNAKNALFIGYPKTINGYPKIKNRKKWCKLLDIQKLLMDIQKLLMDIQKLLMDIQKLAKNLDKKWAMAKKKWAKWLQIVTFSEKSAILAKKNGHKKFLATKMASKKPCIFNGFLHFCPLSHFFLLLICMEKFKIYIVWKKKWVFGHRLFSEKFQHQKGGHHVWTF